MFCWVFWCTRRFCSAKVQIRIQKFLVFFWPTYSRSVWLSGVGSGGRIAIPVTSLKVGDEVLVRKQGGARHTGIEIHEFIVEKWGTLHTLPASPQHSRAGKPTVAVFVLHNNLFKFHQIITESKIDIHTSSICTLLKFKAHCFQNNNNLVQSHDIARRRPFLWVTCKLGNLLSLSGQRSCNLPENYESVKRSGKGNNCHKKHQDTWWHVSFLSILQILWSTSVY
jgi:hypothetical protein